MFLNQQGTMSHHTKLVYASNDPDAFLAAFFYFAFFERSDMIPVATLPVPLTGKTPAPHIRATNTISIGTHMTSPIVWAPVGRVLVGQDSNFFSFENKPTFQRQISIDDMKQNNELPELGRKYVYDRKSTLLNLVLNVIADHYNLTDGNEDKRWILYNQFFGFGSIRNAVLSADVVKKVYDTFPNLQPEDFSEMAKMLKDPYAFFNKTRKTNYEREMDRLTVVAQRERDSSFPNTINGRAVTVYNTDLIDCPFVKELLVRSDHDFGAPVVLIKLSHHVSQGAYSSASGPMLRLRALRPAVDNDFNALDLFDNAVSVVGDSSDAEYLLPLHMLSTFLSPHLNAPHVVV